MLGPLLTGGLAGSDPLSAYLSQPVSVATDEEAVAGTNNTDAMTPLRVAQAMTASGLTGQFLQSGAGAVTTTVSDEIKAIGFRPEQFGAVGDGATDDTVAIQAAINAAQTVKGKVVLASKVYAYSDNLVISGSMTFEGNGVQALYGDGTVNGSTVAPTVSPYLTGSVLLQKGAGKHGLRITASGVSVSLKNFGIRFADTIKFTNTGHGVFIDPPLATGSEQLMGIGGSIIENVCVYGHQGAGKYAFSITNSQLLSFNHIRGFGGGGIQWKTNGGAGVSGNSLFNEPYFCTMVKGSNGFDFRATSGTVYLNQFNRPQSFFLTGFGLANEPDGTDYSLYFDDNCVAWHVIAADMEAASGKSHGVRLPADHSACFWTTALSTGGTTNQAVALLGSGLECGPLKVVGSQASLSSVDRTATGNPMVWYKTGGIIYLFVDSNVLSVNPATGMMALPKIAVGSSGASISGILSATANTDFGSIAANSVHTEIVTVTGAVTTGTPSVAVSLGELEDGLVFAGAWVSSANTVSIKIQNVTGSEIDPDARDIRATVFQF